MSDLRKEERAPLALKVRFKSADLNEFIEQYSFDISKGGLFIKTKKPLEIGTLIKFELQLRDESRIIEGVGRVAWSRTAEDPGAGDRPAGMGIKFIKMSSESKAMVDVIIASRGEGPSTYETGNVDDGQPTQEMNIGALLNAFDSTDEPTHVRDVSDARLDPIQPRAQHDAPADSLAQAVRNLKHLGSQGEVSEDEPTMLSRPPIVPTPPPMPKPSARPSAMRIPSSSPVGLPQDLAASHPAAALHSVRRSSLSLWVWMVLVGSAGGVGWWYYQQGFQKQGVSRVGEPVPKRHEVKVPNVVDASTASQSDAARVAVEDASVVADASDAAQEPMPLSSDLYTLEIVTSPVNAQVIIGGQIFRAPVVVPIQRSQWKNKAIEVFIRKKGFESRIVQVRWSDFEVREASYHKLLELKLEEEDEIAPTPPPASPTPATPPAGTESTGPSEFQ